MTAIVNGGRLPRHACLGLRPPHLVRTGLQDMNTKSSQSSHRLAVLLLCIGVLALSGCLSRGGNGMAPAGSVATSISSVGHLGGMVGIPEFYVNGTWGGNQSGWGGGGSTVCCASLPYSVTGPTMVTVKWKTCDISHIEFKNDRIVDPNARCTTAWHEATVPANFAVPPGNSSGLYVHFLPGNQVQVWFARQYPWSPNYPGPKYPDGPAPDYAPLPGEEPSPAKLAP